jgi:co-chaperonin GroES (HSP10)
MTGKKGKQIPVGAYVGDVVHVRKHSALECKHNGKTYAFVRYDDIVARETSKGLHAMRDMILVKTEYAKKEQMIIIPDQAKQYKGEFAGRVVAVGPDYQHRVSVGDKIKFTRHEGVKVEYENEEYLALKNKWVEAIEYE